MTGGSPFLVLILVVLVSGCPGARAERDRAELERLERRQVAALVARDTAFFRRLELADFRFVGWEGEELTRAEDVAAVGAPRAVVIDSPVVDQLVIRVHRETALVWGRSILRIRSAGAGTRRSGSRFTHVYLRTGDGWRLAAAHASPATLDQESTAP